MITLCIPDLHCPFHHKSAFNFLLRIKKNFNPDKVVCMGDEIDAHGMSRYTKDPSAPGPADEIRRGIKALKHLYELFPEVMVCESNHTWRPFRRAAECGIPGIFFRSVKEVLQAPAGWEWSQSWEVDRVLFVHGEGFAGKNAALEAAVAYRRNVVIGHVHAYAGIQWSASFGSSIFGMNCGCLVDEKSPAMSYAKYNKDRPMLGCGVVADGVPHFIPMK